MGVERIETERVANFEINPLDQFINESNGMANAILHPPPTIKDGKTPDRMVGRVQVFHLFSFSWVGRKIPVREEGKGTFAHMMRLVHYVVFTLISSVATFLIWQNCRQIRDACAEIRDIKEFRSEHLADANPNDPLVSQIKKIADIKQKIFCRIRQDAVVKLALTITCIAAVSLAIASTMVSLPLLPIAAMGTGAVGVGGVLIRWPITALKDRQKRDADEIQKCVAKARNPAPIRPEHSEGKWKFSFIEK